MQGWFLTLKMTFWTCKHCHYLSLLSYVKKRTNRQTDESYARQQRLTPVTSSLQDDVWIILVEADSSFGLPSVIRFCTDNQVNSVKFAGRKKGRKHWPGSSKGHIHSVRVSSKDKSDCSGLDSQSRIASATEGGDKGIWMASEADGKLTWFPRIYIYFPSQISFPIFSPPNYLRKRYWYVWMGSYISWTAVGIYQCGS